MGTQRSGSLNSPRGAPHDDDDGGGGRPWVSPQAFRLDQWVYRDPQVWVGGVRAVRGDVQGGMCHFDLTLARRSAQGVIQGPFAKADILDWLASGFFPIVSGPSPQATERRLMCMSRMPSLNPLV